MKLLLDENLPKRLKRELIGLDTYTVRDMGWNGKSNGELLGLMVKENFDSLITFDKNLQYQQNFARYSIPVLVLNANDNTYQELLKLIPKILDVLNKKLNVGVYLVCFWRKLNKSASFNTGNFALKSSNSLHESECVATSSIHLLN